MTDSQNETPAAQSLAKDGDEVSRCLFAASRKIDIARYHFSELCGQLGRASAGEALPPIPVQAHFEGVVVCVVAAEEKVKEALRSAYGVSRDDERECKRLYSAFARKLPALAKWYANALLGDIRDVRNLAIHQHYEKKLVTEGGPAPVWEVDKPAITKYRGPRELKKYGQSAVEIGAALIGLVPQIEELLRRER
jgi:hypothetical protein